MVDAVGGVVHRVRNRGTQGTRRDGQAGLTVAARLTVLGVDTLLVDRFERVGDNWRNRYHSLTLHNEVWVNDLPYMPFPPNWPVYVPKD